ncbi:MAG TPA: ATP-binding protein, partial [Acetobacteraceae bacterium]|nr:ATP-binding protein [Acetobacteraceae bacterium]
LAAASHDLRQPLQTLTLLQGLLAKSVEGDHARKLMARMDDALGAMSGMPNALLDINQIDAGVVRADVTTFAVNDLLERVRDEFVYHAQAKDLGFRVVPCSLQVSSDPRLLEQILRNLVSNALKYTEQGKVLVGCRRHGGTLSVEIWDTGIGIPQADLATIFEEYHQLDNSARERDRALLLFGFAGALRRSELVALHVEDVGVVADGLRLRIARSKTDPTGQGAEIGLPRGKHAETCPARAFEAWQAVARRKAGPLFRRVSSAGRIGEAALHPDAVRRILAQRARMAGIELDGAERLSAHALRVGFITEAYGKGVRDEDIMRHTRHRDLRTMRGYVQRAGLVTESPAGLLDL